ncbi:MAG TPA: polynucleotide 5'-hydroxyl-kinase [Actinomycetota bacterium]|nr:polynucleotide 5'-hydroxyl-kinase [Actinomycetota bacterium]
MNEHEALVEEAVRTKHTVLLFGGLDTGKSTLSRVLLEAAIGAGRPSAFLDADVGQKTVGPPATVTLKMVRGPQDLEPAAMAQEDGLWFVGSTSPEGHLLQVVTGVASLFRQAKEAGADLVVMDSSGLVSGVHAQILKYHKVEMLRPDLVVGLQRGEELLPLLGVIQRFFATEVVPLGVHPGVVPTTVEQRAENRERAMARYFGQELHRFRVKPTVFMPALPPMFDLTQLDHLLVGLSDGAGGYLGLGYLEHLAEEGILRLISPVAAGPKALRLGSVRLEEGYRAKRVDLRNLFGSG